MKRLALPCLLLMLIGSTLHAAERNIIFFITDDESPTLGCYGDTAAVTPADVRVGRVILAPMEGVLDPLMRELLTAITFYLHPQDSHDKQQQESLHPFIHTPHPKNQNPTKIIHVFQSSLYLSRLFTLLYFFVVLLY